MTKKKIPQFSIPKKKPEPNSPTTDTAAAVDYIEGRDGSAPSHPPKRVAKSPRPESVAQDKEGEASQHIVRKKPKSSPLRRSEAGQRLVIYLPPELEAQLRIRSAKERRSLSDLVSAALSRYLHE